MAQGGAHAGTRACYATQYVNLYFTTLYHTVLYCTALCRALAPVLPHYTVQTVPVLPLLLLVLAVAGAA